MTTRYYILNVKCGVSDGGMACGPVQGVVTGAVQFRKDDDNPMWLTLSDAEGLANFYLTSEDVYDRILEEDDDEFFDELNDKYFITEFDGISFGDEGDFDEILQDIEANQDKPAANLVLYLIAIVRCGWDELPGLVEAGKGKYADEIDLSGYEVE